jgi:mono/diheme cytochrome c family protein
VVALSVDGSPRVTLQTALSLGASPSSDAVLAMVSIAQRHGRQYFVADAIVSGLAGRENAFIKGAVTGGDNEKISSAVILATSAVLRSRDVGKINQLLATLAEASTPLWAQEAILRGIERFLPRTPEGKLVSVDLGFEPAALVELAAHGAGPVGQQAAGLLNFLRWPGKPGAEDDAVKIAARLTAQEKKLFDQGSGLFAGICAACHQPHGEGLEGLAPQLLYSRHVLGPEQALVRIVLNGKVLDGRVMPPLGSLDDEAIASILTYIRNSWGHHAAAVTPATVAQIRKEVAGREEPWTNEELATFGR